MHCWWKNSCTTWDVENPENNGIKYVSTGAGFLPSTETQSNCRPGCSICSFARHYKHQPEKKNILRTCCCCPLQGWRCTRPPQFADRMAWSLTAKAHLKATGRRSGFLIRRSLLRSYLKLRNVSKMVMCFCLFSKFLGWNCFRFQLGAPAMVTHGYTQEGHSFSFWPRVLRLQIQIFWAH